MVNGYIFVYLLSNFVFFGYCLSERKIWNLSLSKLYLFFGMKLYIELGIDKSD